MENKNKNILLAGFMGSGKTTVAGLLASRYKMRHLDTDLLIEQTMGMSIDAIFKTKGEAAFRQAESDCIKKLANAALSHTVISVGGGLPLRKENRALCRAIGTVVHLKVTPQAVCERLKGDTTRPLLQGADPMPKIKELMAAREEAYRDIADVTVLTDSLSPAQIADRVFDLCFEED